jgi:two-component system CheB/CheR fusion protein
MSGEDGAQSVVVDATNRRGKLIRCRVTCSPLVGDDKDIRGVILVVEERPDEHQAAARS